MLNHGAMGGSPETRKDEWETPRWFWEPLHRYFRFTVDAASSHQNALLPLHWTQEENALVQDWSIHRVWCNPPYTMKDEFLGMGPLAVLSVYLLPNATDAAWWWDAQEKAETWLIKGRIPFLLDGQLPKRVDPKTGKLVSTGNNKGSCLFLFGEGAEPGLIRRMPHIDGL